MKTKTEHTENRKLFVGIKGLDQNVERSLSQYFSRWGAVLGVVLFKKGTGATVEFASVESVQQVLGRRSHYISGKRVLVKPFRAHVTRKEIQQRKAEEEIQAREETHHEIIALLETCDDVGEQLSRLQCHTRLDAQDEEIRSRICWELERIFRPYFTKCQVIPFGSSVNSFGTKGCDLDLFLDIQDSDVPGEEKPSVPLPFHKDIGSLRHLLNGPLSKAQMEACPPLDQVKLLSRILTQWRSEFTDTMTIPSTRCPVVQFSHAPTAIKCDLSINNRKAIYNSRLLRWFGSDPLVNRVVLAVRLWAREQGVAGGVNKGHTLSNYALTWLVLHYLQARTPPAVPRVDQLPSLIPGLCYEEVSGWRCAVLPPDPPPPTSQSTDSEVTVLKGFFDFYASDVDWTTTALCTHDGSSVPRSQLADQHPDLKVAQMTVTDPFVLSHNITANINERTRVRFQLAVQEASRLASAWDGVGGREAGKAWGLTALLTPVPEDAVSQLMPSPKREATVEGEQPNGTFELTLRPPDPPQRSGCSAGAGTEGSVQVGSEGCKLLQGLVVEVLRSVFCVEIKDVQQDKREGTSYEKDAASSMSSTLTEDLGSKPSPLEAKPKFEREDTVQHITADPDRSGSKDFPGDVGERSKTLKSSKASVDTSGKKETNPTKIEAPKGSHSNEDSQDVNDICSVSQTIEHQPRNEQVEQGLETQKQEYQAIKEKKDMLRTSMGRSDITSEQIADHPICTPPQVDSEGSSLKVEGPTSGEKRARAFSPLSDSCARSDASPVKKSRKSGSEEFPEVSENPSSLNTISVMREEAKEMVEEKIVVSDSGAKASCRQPVSQAHTSLSNPDEQHSAGALKEGKSESIQSHFLCQCRKTLWVSRKKTKVKLGRRDTRTGLAQEIAVSETLLRDQDSLNQKLMSNQSQAHSDTLSQENKRQPSSSMQNGNLQQSATDEGIQKTKHPLEFSCLFKEDKEKMHVVFMPTQASIAVFRAFFICFKSIINRLVQEDLYTWQKK